MRKPWQDLVAWNHIDGNPRNNDRENLQLVHARTCKPLTQCELNNYCNYLQRKLRNMLATRL